MAKKFFSRMWGVFSALGQFISGILGIYFCYNVIKIALGQVIQMYNVYQLVGFTRDFILSWFPIVGKHVLIKNLRTRSGLRRKENPPPDIEVEEPKAYLG